MGKNIYLKWEESKFLFWQLTNMDDDLEESQKPRDSLLSKVERLYFDKKGSSFYLSIDESKFLFWQLTNMDDDLAESQKPRDSLLSKVEKTFFERGKMENI